MVCFWYEFGIFGMFDEWTSKRMNEAVDGKICEVCDILILDLGGVVCKF